MTTDDDLFVPPKVLLMQQNAHAHAHAHARSTIPMAVAWYDFEKRKNGSALD